MSFLQFILLDLISIISLLITDLIGFYLNLLIRTCRGLYVNKIKLKIIESNNNGLIAKSVLLQKTYGKTG